MDNEERTSNIMQAVLETVKGIMPGKEDGGMKLETIEIEEPVKEEAVKEETAPIENTEFEAKEESTETTFETALEEVAEAATEARTEENVPEESITEETTETNEETVTAEEETTETEETPTQETTTENTVESVPNTEITHTSPFTSETTPSMAETSLLTGLNSPDFIDAKKQQTQIKNTVEAVLFLTDKSITAVEIAERINIDVNEVRQALSQLIQEYEARDTAVEISALDGYIMQLKDEYSFLTEEMLPMEIKTGCLRTLSAIALKEPAMQPDVIEMRGGGAYLHIKELIDMGLITKKKEGTTNVLRTTDMFSKYFKLSNNGIELQDVLKASSARRKRRRKKKKETEETANTAETGNNIEDGRLESSNPHMGGTGQLSPTEA